MEKEKEDKIRDLIALVLLGLFMLVFLIIINIKSIKISIKALYNIINKIGETPDEK